MRFLITSGPTREPIDAVRFISNPSTGRMGFAVAAAAVEAGHDATVISGPTALRPPDGVTVEFVTTTREMLEAVEARFADADVFIAAAAPCDYRPAERCAGKLKKDRGELTLRLERNPDILREMSLRKEGRVLIGFAMEVQDARENALRKLREKRLDAVVLNSPAAFGARESAVTLLRADGREERLGRLNKDELGHRLVRLAEELRNAAAT